VTLSLLGSCAVCERTHGPQLMRISASGERTVLVTGQVGEAISGNTRGSDGTVYSSVWAPGNAARNDVYKLLPEGTPQRIAPLPADSGPNGLRFHNGALWVSNFNKGTMLRVPVTTTGAAGPIRLVAGGLPDIDDLSFLTPRSDVVFAAQNGSSSQNGPDRVVVIYPNGT
jgi:hypothetical protein